MPNGIAYKFKIGDEVRVIQKRTLQGLSVGVRFKVKEFQEQPKFYPSGYSVNGLVNGILWGVDPIDLELVSKD